MLLRSLLLAVVALFGTLTAAEAQGLLTDEPHGFRTLVTFPGANVEAGLGWTTVLTCSSVDPKPITVRIQLFSLFDGALAGETETVLLPGQTMNASAGGQSTIFLATVGIPVNLSVNGGPLRVLTDGSKKMLCTANILSASQATPLSAIPLPGFYR